MARLPRVVIADVAHHVTQRGNARQVIFGGDPDRIAYLELLRQHCALYRLSLLGYCLMSNHVHLIVIPRAAHSLAQALKHTHGRYAAYWNARQSSSGHVWQGRFYSCPLDDSHLWIALRYVELNPVRAGMAAAAAQWKWSSVAAHCGASLAAPLLEMDLWRKRWTAAEWRSLSCRRRIVGRSRGAAAVHPHRPAAGEHRLRCRAGTIHFAAARPAQARPPWEAHPWGEIRGQTELTPIPRPNPGNRRPKATKPCATHACI